MDDVRHETAQAGSELTRPGIVDDWAEARANRVAVVRSINCISAIFR